MFGMPQIPYGLLGVAGGTDMRPTNTPQDMSALMTALKAVHAQNATPNGMVQRGFNQFGPVASNPAPMLPTPPTPAPVDMSDEPTPPALSARAMAPAPVPSPAQNVGPTSVGGAPLPTSSPLDSAQWPSGPASGPQAPPAGPGFFANNAAMMRDPSSNAFIGPGMSDAPQASGPDVINKLMSYFKNKDNA